jgi:hypothetical protein
MSYKHANAVAVKSKTRGMQNLVFYRLACLIQDDGYLIEGQEVLAAILRISIGCLRNYTNHFQEIGELQKIVGRGNGNATRYRSLLGEMETKDMLAHFKEIEAERKYQIEVLKGTPHTPFNEDTKGTPHTPLDDLKGTPQNLKGTPQNLKGTHRAPSRTTRTTKTTRTQNAKPFLESNSKDKTDGMPMNEWLIKFPHLATLKENDRLYEIGRNSNLDKEEVDRELELFIEGAITSGEVSKDWLQTFEDYLVNHLIPKVKNTKNQSQKRVFREKAQYIELPITNRSNF